MSEAPLYPSSALFRKTTHWFERARASLLDHLPCRQGCSDCCIGLFPVTILDRHEIQRGLQLLPMEHRKRVEAKAQEQVSQLRVAVSRLRTTQFVDHWSDEEMDEVIERFDSLPCPALEPDGRCGVYEFRPLVCRSMGIPSDDGQRVVGACAVQTAVPLIRLSNSLREEEQVLAGMEARHLAHVRMALGGQGEELLLPYAFVSELALEREKDTI